MVKLKIERSWNQTNMIFVSSSILKFTGCSKMQFSTIDPIIIQNEIDEFNLNVYQIWKRHSQKNGRIEVLAVW